jgi:hypothetical protein
MVSYEIFHKDIYKIAQHQQFHPRVAKLNFEAKLYTDIEASGK